MKRSPRIFNAFRLAGLLAILIIGLVSIIGTGGSSGGGYSSDTEGLFYHRDADGDGYGDPNDTIRKTTKPDGYVTDKRDCNDSDPDINPGVAEVCGDGIDNNCDGLINEGCACTDADNDGYFAQSGCGTPIDCDDTEPEINPGTYEVCGDGLDNNCDGLIDDNCVNCTDADGDGYFVQADCGKAVDCDDANPDINPGMPDICVNDIDDDCDGQVDENCPLLPDTGQDDCYDRKGTIIDCPAQGQAFYGQDAFYSINPPYYTKLDDTGIELPGDAASWAMVRDNATGLIWEVKTDDSSIHDRDNRYTWYTVDDNFIASLNAGQFGGYDDWRMPTIKDLFYITDFSSYTPAIDIDYFLNTAKGAYLAFVDPADDTSGSCRLNYLDGRCYTISAPGSFYARAVRGVQSTPSFTVNANNTVTDSTTGLTWARGASMATMTWQEALEWCSNMTLAGFDDWRLPSIKELFSIVEIEAGNPATDTAVFPDALLAYYWSSTTSAYYPDEAWLINFSTGESAYGEKTGTYYARAVRGGK